MNTSSALAPLPFFANFIEPPIGFVDILASDAPNIIVVVEPGQV